MAAASETGHAEGHVTVGRFGAAHGVKGWLRVISFMDPPANILGYSRFLMREAGALKLIEIDAGRPQGKALVVHVKGCDDREQCRHYTGRELFLPKDELPRLEQGEFYWHQLQGLRVLSTAGEDLGLVDHLMETGANDVLVLRGSPSSIDQRERLIPYVPGQVVREVDLDAGLIRVEWDSDF